MSRILFLIFTGLILKISCESKIKGKQYIRHTTTARLIGGRIPQEILDILNENSSQPIVSPIPTPPLGGLPLLITEDVKMVVTRMAIPLDLNTENHEKYMKTLKKFLVSNQIEIVGNMRRSAGNVMSLSQIENRLQQAEIFSRNLQAVLYDVLVSGRELAEGNHAALVHVFKLLQLRRIPVVDLVNRAEELLTQTIHDQWLTIFLEMEHLIPTYMRSCVTHILQSLQTGHKITINTDSQTENLFLKHIKLNKIHPIEFPIDLISEIPPSHIEQLGESTAGLLTTVREYGQMTPKLLRLFVKSLPRNKISNEEDAIYLKMDQRKASDVERKIVTKAARKGFENFNRKPCEIFRDILTDIAGSDFGGVEDYKMLLRVFQMPRENYIVIH